MIDRSMSRDLIFSLLGFFCGLVCSVDAHTGYYDDNSAYEAMERVRISEQEHAADLMDLRIRQIENQLREMETD